MAKVSFGVPEEVKVAFDRAFGHTNKSQVIAQLMRDAVESEARARRRSSATRAIRRLRAALGQTSRG